MSDKNLADEVRRVANKTMPTDSDVLLARIDELKYACLAAIGYLRGMSICDEAAIVATLKEAVKLYDEPYPSRR